MFLEVGVFLGIIAVFIGFIILFTKELSFGLYLIVFGVIFTVVSIYLVSTKEYSEDVIIELAGEQLITNRDLDENSISSKVEDWIFSNIKEFYNIKVSGRAKGESAEIIIKFYPKE